MERAKNCCGFGRGGSVISTAGLFFFVFPAYAAFCAACFLFRLPAGFSSGAAAAAGFSREMRRVLLAMLNDSAACGARCAVSGRLVGLSPALAGAFYKYAIPALMALSWVLLLSVVRAVI